ncbi:MAG: peptidoglycan DD-metalloendopeptidase family protein [Bacteroidales bacterium]|nr:peptidoglycan DD-metalloendopeptidase family protein [Bacteroidales bacterium]
MTLASIITTPKIFAASFALAFLGWGNAAAQTYRLPGQHDQQSADLLANQEHLTEQFNLSVNNYIDYEEEEEPEMDIYTEGWDSKLVNCYAGVEVPNRATIDVTNFSMPHPGYVTSPYGYRKRFRRMHKGIDLKVNVGDTIRAAFDGRVRITNFERKGYGNYVVLRHTNDLETVYGHLSAFLVEPDQYVKAGDPIALGGNTGRSTGPHLHFETRYMGYAINPAAIFDFANQTTHTDLFTFDKSTYQNARNFDPKANAEYAKAYLAEHPNKPYTRNNVSALKGANNTASASSGSSSGSSTYVVKKGDSLSRIATRNGTTVAKLCKLNNLKTTSRLTPGQKLKLR